ncbi:hypothetical protein KPH14_009204 [Odynerus spinipes]|uniref:Uncharacterized protein n=1 Tax=Odynerus spinipes TaxID=1348599 RepID=A0AAD9RNW0_9HYME|nr:hypothetical protein KPH14_009204 [Odynerus spinipes]
MLGAWPLEADASILEKCKKYLLNLICYLLLIFFFVPSILYIVFIPQSVSVKLKIAATAFACVANAAKYTLLLKQSKQLEMCLYRVREDWRLVKLDEDYESMISRGKLGRTLAILSTCLIYGGSMSYRTIMPFAKGKIMVNNITIRPLACPSYYIVFDEQKSPAYELVFIGHFLSGFVVYSVASAVCALTTFFILHACGQLEILIRKMKEIEITYTNEEGMDKRIVKIVLHQMKTRRQVSTSEVK